MNETVQELHTGLYPDFKRTLDVLAARTFFTARLGAIAVAELDGGRQRAWYESESRPETLISPERTRLYVQHLSVQHLSVRRRRGDGGVGAALMRRAEQTAHDQGLREIALGL